MTSFLVPFQPSMCRLGLGYDTLSGAVRGSPFEEALDQETTLFHENNWLEDGSPGSAVEYKYRFIESKKELLDSMNISGALNVTKGAFSGSVEGKFEKMKLDTSSNEYMLVSVMVRHSVARIKGQPVVDKNKNPLDNLSLKQDTFLEMFGDTYISALEIGGRLEGVIEIKANSNESRQNIKADAAAGKEGVASGKIGIDTLVSNMTSGRSANVTVSIQGGGVQLVPMDPVSFVKLFRMFPAMVFGGDAFLRIGVSSAGATQVFGLGERKKLEDTQLGEGDRAEGEEEAPEVTVDAVKFVGTAVPLRAVVTKYKGIPDFSKTESELARLSSYVLDDVVEKYLSCEEVKKQISDIMEDRDSVLQLPQLRDLSEKRDALRMMQVKLLATVKAAEAEADEKAAEIAVDALRKLEIYPQVPPQVHNLQARSLYKKAQGAKASQKLREREQVKRKSELRNVERLRFQKFLDNTFPLVSVDETTTRISGGAYMSFSYGADDEAYVLQGVVSKSLIIFDRTAEETDDLLFLKTVNSEDELREELQRKMDSGTHRVLERRVPARIEELLDQDEVDVERFVREGIDLQDAAKKDTAAFLMESMKDEKFTASEKSLYAVRAGPTVQAFQSSTLGLPKATMYFRIHIVDGAQHLARVQSTDGQYWRHTLQFMEHGIITLAPLEQNFDDKSYIFKFIDEGPGKIKIYAHQMETKPAWELFMFGAVENDPAFSPLLCTRPAGGETESDWSAEFSWSVPSNGNSA
ncbi:hypothetical protein NDN08_004684 [Rhodosorus marinus]|uniref:Uncharacterized protein n=1 Tax=Rhodosorus marinus TaxID=101924 RepID=A0AAV8ULZ2_9RHOD|nr:hypothetical protein NDN08_004684 [Rhodosorus marinus]